MCVCAHVSKRERVKTSIYDNTVYRCSLPGQEEEEEEEEPGEYKDKRKTVEPFIEQAPSGTWCFVQRGTVCLRNKGSERNFRNNLKSYKKHRNQNRNKEEASLILCVDTNTAYSVPCVWSRPLILFRKERETPVSFGSEPSVVTTLQPPPSPPPTPYVSHRKPSPQAQHQSPHERGSNPKLSTVASLAFN